MLRTLVLTRHIPFPPKGGAPLRNWQNINLLSQLGQTSVLSVSAEPANVESNPAIFDWRHVNLRQSSPYNKLAAKLRKKYWALRPGTHPNAPFSSLAASNLCDLLEESSADLLVVEELWLYPYLDKLRGWKGKLVYDAHNIEAMLRTEIEPSHGDSRNGMRQRLLSTRVSAAERAVARKVDQVWACSQADALKIKNLYSCLKLKIKIL